MDLINFFKQAIFLVTIFLGSTLISMGQNVKVKKLESDADHYFKFDKNYEALNLYLQIDSISPNDPKILARIGICYVYHIKARALPYLIRAKEMNYKEDHIDYYLARAYHLSHKFDKAIELYQICKPSLRSKLVKKDIDLFMVNCKDGKELVKDSLHVQIENLGLAINTPYNEYAPIISADESTLIFTSQRPVLGGKKKNEYLTSDDIYISNKEDGTWGKAESIGPPVNTSGNDASVSFSMDGEEIYIYKSDSLNPGGGHLFVSKKDGGNWKTPVKMGPNVNSGDGWEPSISIGPNEDYVFFTSNKPGGYGGLDIYVSKKNSYNEWGRAKNLGPLINTAEDEDAPFIHPDGKTLYFSSKGHPSIGGFDIYSCNYFFDNDSVSVPVNLGYPINTADDEIFFIWSADGTRGYFSSAREDTYGRSDIYMVTRPEIEVDLILFSGNVKTIDNKLVAASITIVDNETNKIVGYYDSTKFKGKFTISLSPGKNYGISIEAKNYLTYSDNINIPVNGFHDIKKDIKLVPLDKGGLIVLKNVLFEPGKAELNSSSHSELDRYYNVIKENPTYMMEIAGHAFDLEDHKSNLELSEKRAQAVVNYLIKKGANAENLRAVGYGDKYKISDDNSLNTRTEFIIKQNLVRTKKIEEKYYNINEAKAISEAKEDANNSISAKLKQQNDYLIKKDEDVYFGVNNSKSLKEFKANEEVKDKVRKGTLQPILIKGHVTDVATGKGLHSVIVITDPNGKKISETKTSDDGIYSIEVFNSKDKKYTITVHTNGYNYASKDIQAQANNTSKKEVLTDFNLHVLEVGKSYIVRNIYFDFNTATFKQESYKELKKLETLLKKNKSVKVEISAHTDNKGEAAYNLVLSQKRAEAVVNYLSGKGIAADRIIAKGYGEERPLATNDDESEGRELNRRIEFEILEK